MPFFIPFPFPNFGNGFFHSLPVPEFWEWAFQFPSRSRTLGMKFSIPVPVPEPSKVIPAHPCENGTLEDDFDFDFIDQDLPTLSNLEFYLS